ncbi:programmed cell death protein 2 [Dissophora ornata]|nr:programmed cell death protein 2 [Dissophora ornata]
MDKKTSKSSSSRNAHSEDKVAEGLKNLNLGGSIPTQKGGSSHHNSNINSNKNAKKSKKSNVNGTSTGSSTSSSTPAPPKKKSGPILLGMPDAPMESQDDTDPYVTKIGGVPLWLEHDLPAPSKYGVCEACGKNMYLLLQAYVPLEKSPYDRVVYIWACNQRLCMRKKGSFRVVRALKLNPEYAQKLEKKPKAAAAAAPVVASAPKPALGASAVNPANAMNPFAPPARFGVASPVPASATPAAKSFASVTSSNIPEKQESAEEEESEGTVQRFLYQIFQSWWPESPPSFEPHYLYITEEVLDDSNAVNDEIAQRYGHFLALEEAAKNDDDSADNNGASWSGEAYEKAALPKGVDKAFQKFTERVQAWPDQCVRYDFPGIPLLFSYSDKTAQTLLPPNASQHSKHTTPSAHRILRCPACKGPRGFEFQLMPNLLSLLDVTSKKYLSEEENKSLKERKGAQMFDIGMEWGTILVYSCAEDCFGRKVQREDDDRAATSRNKVKYFEEVALVQFED